jgi:3-methyladenine DNA glycosylase AlkD
MKGFSVTVEDVINALKEYGNETTKKIYLTHGAKEPLFGVKVQDLKKILKKTKKNHEVSLALYATGNSDAMYLAGLMADEKQIQKATLQQWVNEAYWYYISEYTVPWVAAESPFAMELGLEWIEAKEETVAAAGWSTLAYYASLVPDDQLDKPLYKSLLDRIGENIHKSPNRVRYVMNGFVIAVGSHVASLTGHATQIAGIIGKVSVDMGGTACKVPLATSYIDKVAQKNKIGNKRKTVRC